MNASNVVLVFIFLLGISFLLSMSFVMINNMLRKIQWLLIKNRIKKLMKKSAENNIVNSIIDINLLKLKTDDVEKKIIAINSIMSMQNEWQNDIALKEKVIKNLFLAIESEKNMETKIKIMRLISDILN